jgi:Tol biopolymer transport system component
MTRVLGLIGWTALATVIAAPGPAARQDGGEVSLRAAIETETVKGDLDSAIRQYQALADAYAHTNRALAARALLRLADAYRKLGDAKATGVYERIVREFGDQTEAAAAAKGRLGASTHAARTSGDRVVKAGPSTTWGDGRVSPDGWLISYTDWEHTGNLMVHDLRTGADRALTTNKDWSVGCAYSSTFSPDGQQVAYGWRTWGSGASAHVNELRILNVTAPETSGGRRVHMNPEIDFYHPTDWSPDGRLLAVKVIRKDGSGQLGVMDVRDGSFRGLRSFGWRGPNKIFFSPDGKHLAYDLPSSEEASTRDVFVIAADATHETRVIGDPADDVVMGWLPDGTRLLFASDRTGAVGLWAVPVSGAKASGPPSLLKPDIGSVLSQGLTRQGTLHIVRDSSTLSLQTAPFNLAAGTLTGPPSIENFRSGRPDWGRDGRSIAYRTAGVNGQPFISVRSLHTGKIRELRPALAYINEPRWLPDQSALVTFGRDFKGRGGVYRIDGRTGTATLVADSSDISRVQVSPGGRKIYYNVGFVVPGNGPARYVERDLQTGEIRDIHLDPPGFGHAELSPDGHWLAYVAEDGASKAVVLMLKPVEGGAPRRLLEVPRPARVDPFVGLLWTPDNSALLMLKSVGGPENTREIWQVPLEGGSPRKLPLEASSWKTELGLRLNPDGTRLAFFTGEESREVWALEGLPAAVTMRRPR